MQLKQDSYIAMFKKHSAIMFLFEVQSGKIVDANESAEKFYGYTHEEFLRLKVSDINMLPPDELALRRNESVNHIAEHFIFPHRLKNNEIRTVEVFASPIEIDGKTLLYSIIRDVTEAKKNEEKLQRLNDEKEELYTGIENLNKKMQALNQNIPGVVYTYQYYPDGHSRFPYASEHIYDIYGVTPQEVSEDASKVFAVLYPEDVDHVVKSITQSYENLTVWKDEYRVNHPDKGVIWVQGSARPQKQKDGSVLWYGYIFDITQKKQMDIQLQNAKQYYETLLEYASDSIHILDAEGDLVACSRSFAQHLGYTYEEAISLNLRDWEGSIQEENLKDTIVQILASPRAFETKHRKKDGTLIDVHVNAKKIILNGKAYLYASARDISDIKKMERQLKTILNLSPIAVRIAKSDGQKVVFANKAYEELLRVDNVQQVLDKNPRDYYADPKIYDDIVWHVQNGKAIYHKEVELNIKGDTVWALCSYMPIEFDGDSAVLGWFYDLTYTKDLLKMLEAQKEFTTQIVQNSNAIIAVIQPDGVMSLLNAYGENFTGYSQAEVASQPYFWSRFLNKSQQEGVYGVVEAAKEGQIVQSFQNSWFSKTGEERTFEWSNTLKTKPDGTLDYIFTIGIDIQEKIEAQEELLAQKEEFKTIFEISRNGIAILDLESNFLDCNQAYLEMTGFTREELLKTSCLALSVPEDHERSEKALQIVLQQGYLSHFEKKCLVKDGKHIAVQMSISLMPDKQRILISVTDISAMKEHESDLQRIANYDILTQLPNRILLSERMRQVMATTQRSGQKMAVVYLDLDGFKQVNDTYGHKAGDTLLIEVSSRMQNVLREEDTLARLGGDEFVAILGSQENEANTMKVLERLLEAASLPIVIEESAVSVSASIGVTFYSSAQGHKDADTLLRESDQAMYEAKVRGKNQIAVFEELQREFFHSGEQALDIKNALNNNEFTLYYQPKVDMKQGKVIGAEALIRWNDPLRGTVYPDEFLPAVNNRPLMFEIDKWVLNTALEQMNVWASEGFNIRVSINISAYTFKQSNLIELIDELLQLYPLVSSSQIDIEILESSSLHEIREVRQIIEKLHERSIGVSLDDFGTGYSTLAYLKSLGVDTLKIDKSFIVDILHDSGDLSIIEASIGLAEAFHANVLAEGVESLEHGKLLIQLGSNLAQGYVIARPMRAHKLLTWIKKYKAPAIWTDTKKIDKKYMPLIYGGVEHRRWIQGVENYILKKSDFLPEMHKESCVFGKWLQERETQKYFTQDTYAKIKNIHNRLHTAAGEILSSKPLEQKALLKSLYELQTSLLDTLSLE